jgi:hypothetical protein
VDHVREEVHDIPNIPAGLVRSISQIFLGSMNNASPRIIMIKERGCFSSILPNPAIAKSNIDGHMIDKNKPPEKENLAISVSVQTNPDSIINNPDIPKASMFFQHFYPPKTYSINNKIQIG